jgi:hypothetical protein
VPGFPVSLLRGWSGVALHFFFTICFVKQGLKARI